MQTGLFPALPQAKDNARGTSWGGGWDLGDTKIKLATNLNTPAETLRYFRKNENVL